MQPLIESHFTQGNALPQGGFATWPELVLHCERTTGPVAREGLHLVGIDDADCGRLGQTLGVGLLLVRCWQGVRRDIAFHDRVTIPRDIAAKHGLRLDLLRATVAADVAAGDVCGCVDVPSAGVHVLRPAYRATMKELVNLTRPMLDAGAALAPQLPSPASAHVRHLTLGGIAVLNRIRSIGYDTLSTEPHLTLAGRAGLALRRGLSL